MTSAENILDRIPSQATRTVYTRQWRRFSDYCDQLGLTPLPAQTNTIIGYLEDQAAYDPLTGRPLRAYSTISQSLAAITYVHKIADTVPANPAGGHFDHAGINYAVTEHMARLRARYEKGTRGKSAHTKTLTPNYLAQVIKKARRDAATWQDWYYERRDAALIVTIAHTKVSRRDFESLRLIDIAITPHGDGRTFERPTAKGRHRIRIAPTKKFHTCAPCVWARWLEVHVAHNRDGTEGLIDLLTSDTAPASHICTSQTVDTAELPSEGPLFPAGRPTQIASAPMTGNAAYATIRQRLHAGIPRVDPQRFTLRSLHGALETDVPINLLGSE